VTVWAPAAANAIGCSDSWTNTAGGSWFTPGNWSTKAVPTSSDEACVTAAGTYTVELNGATVSLKSLTVGAPSGTQTLQVASTNSANTSLGTSAGISNGAHGVITLTNAETSGNSVTLSGTIANAGTIDVEKAIGGSRTLSGSLTNTGTLAINTNTTYNGASAALVNEGALNIASGAQLVASNSSQVTDGAGGKIAATGTGNVQIESTSAYNQGAGTTTGTKPVIVHNGALNYTGSGSSAVAAHGEAVTLSGNISAGQSLSIESTNSENAPASVAGSFSSAGTITLTNSETSANNAHLTISSGTLTNSGAINTEKAVGGQRTIEGNLTNKGTLAINANTSYDGAEKALLNEGSINLATGLALDVTGKSTVTNGTGGKINATGTGVLFQVEGTFNEGLGTTTTAKTSEPMVLDRVALHYTGKGESKIAQRGAGTLSGTVNAKVTLTLESTCFEHNETTAAGSFLNSGTINLTNIETCANNVRLALAGGTLENKGTINALFPHGGSRTIEGGLVNEKTLAIGNDPSQSLKVTGNYSEGAKSALKLTIAGAANYSRLLVGGSAALGGTLSLKQVKFTGKAGESFGVVAAASRTGEFAAVTGNAIKGGVLHYVPHYTATGMNLLVE
jgi:hypothetical protein